MSQAMTVICVRSRDQSDGVIVFVIGQEPLAEDVWSLEIVLSDLLGRRIMVTMASAPPQRRSSEPLRG